MAENKVDVNKKEEAKESNKFGLQESHTVQGVTYTFQFPGVKNTLEILDRSRNAFGNVVDSKYYEELMDNVIVEPKTDWDYWDEHNGIREVMNLADNFLGRQL